MQASAAQAPSPQASARPVQPIEHAVVLGGSVAGLLAARVLAPHAARVTLVERDRPSGPARSPRKGVPQGHHAHLLLQPGLDSLSALFPGIEAELAAVAGPAFDVVRETLWRIDGLYRPRFASEYRAYALGRPALEALVRRRVEALANVELAYGESATGLVVERGAVTGVKLGAAQERILRADLAVDASGRGTRVPAWLEAAGYPAPPSRRAELNLSYTSCIVELPADLTRDFRVLLVPPVHPSCPRGGLLLPLEDGRFVATLIAYGDEPAPRDMPGFLAAAARVDDPRYRQLLERCVARGEPTSFSIPRQEWRRYDRVRRLPRRLIAIGDALCSFDPAFGQGMSVAALEARALEALLADHALALDALAPRYFARTSRLIATPWSMGRARPTGGAQPRSLKKRLLRGYQRALLRAAARSPALHRAFVRVVNLEAPPASLLAPALAARVLAAGVARALTAESAPPTARAEAAIRSS